MPDLPASATPRTSPDAPAGASGEVRAKRRTYTSAEKLRLLREAERCPQGELGQFLRREGLYSSHLTKWRAQRDRGQLTGAARKRGPQVDEPAQQRAHLERENKRLTAKLAKAELIIEAQKKLLQVLGLPDPDRPAPSETPSW